MDRRAAKGMRSLNVWVPKELGEKLDRARDLVPMQRFVVRILEREMAWREQYLRYAVLVRKSDSADPVQHGRKMLVEHAASNNLKMAAVEDPIDFGDAVGVAGLFFALPAEEIER